MLALFFLCIHMYSLSAVFSSPSSSSLKVSMSLADFHVWAKEVVRVACEDALTSEGFVPDPVEEQRAGRNNKVRNNAKTFDIGIRDQAKGSRERIAIKSLVVVPFISFLCSLISSLTTHSNNTLLPNPDMYSSRTRESKGVCP